MQGLCNGSLMWVCEMAGVMLPLVILSFFMGTPKNEGVM